MKIVAIENLQHFIYKANENYVAFFHSMCILLA